MLLFRSEEERAGWPSGMPPATEPCFAARRGDRAALAHRSPLALAQRAEVELSAAADRGVWRYAHWRARPGRSTTSVLNTRARIAARAPRRPSSQ